VRISRADIVAGIPAVLARDVLKYFRAREHPMGVAEPLLKGSGVDIEAAFRALEAEGYVRVCNEYRGETVWTNTIKGNALSMASLGKPIARSTADRLLAGMLDRARAYNADAGKILYVDRLRIFGSYLDESVQQLGDLDVELVFGHRTNDPQALHAYVARSGRTFSTFVDGLFWPETELRQILRNRSGFINITLEDTDLIAAGARTVYGITDDPAAIPPPAAPPKQR
jgi:hypothetical protein